MKNCRHFWRRRRPIVYPHTVVWRCYRCNPRNHFEEEQAPERHLRIVK